MVLKFLFGVVHCPTLLVDVSTLFTRMGVVHHVCKNCTTLFTVFVPLYDNTVLLVQLVGLLPFMGSMFDWGYFCSPVQDSVVILLQRQTINLLLSQSRVLGMSPVLCLKMFRYLTPVLLITWLSQCSFISPHTQNCLESNTNVLLFGPMPLLLDVATFNVNLPHTWNDILHVPKT